MRRWHPFWIGTVAAVVAIAAGTGVVLAFGGDDDPEPPAVEAELRFDEDDDESGQDDLIGGDPTGEAAPDATFTLLEGGSMSLADLRGTPVVVNFFAEWCVPCVTEMPAFEEIHQVLGDRVAFVGLDVRDSVEKGKRLIEQTGVTYTIGRDPSGGIFQSFDAINMPSTFLLAADGTVVKSHAGALTADELHALIDELLLDSRLLAGAPDAGLGETDVTEVPR